MTKNTLLTKTQTWSKNKFNLKEIIGSWLKPLSKSHEKGKTEFI
jgi:hypothetical protein